MFNQSRFKIALNNYKKDFTTSRWKTEKYKWEAVKTFQDNWNIDATNFADMLKNSIPKEVKAGLFNFVYTTSFSYIEYFAENEPETVRKMFLDLFDEDKEIYERIDNFKEASKKLSGYSIDYYMCKDTFNQTEFAHQVKAILTKYHV